MYELCVMSVKANEIPSDVRLILSLNLVWILIYWVVYRMQEQMISFIIKWWGSSNITSFKCRWRVEQ